MLCHTKSSQQQSSLILILIMDFNGHTHTHMTFKSLRFKSYGIIEQKTQEEEEAAAEVMNVKKPYCVYSLLLCVCFL